MAHKPWTSKSLMGIAIYSGNLGLIKLLHKYHFNWKLLSKYKRPNFADLCQIGSVDCMKFVLKHCKNWISPKIDDSRSHDISDDDSTYAFGPPRSTTKYYKRS